MINKIALFLFIVPFISTAQIEKISGTIYDEYLSGFTNARITSNEDTTVSDTEGNFTIAINVEELPQEIIITAYGYDPEKIIIRKADQSISVILKERLDIDQIITSASRRPERIIESPVTIERLNLNDVRKKSANNFYEALRGLNELQVRDAGYTYNSVNTRGFADFANSRFVQIVDGVDNASPAFNYSLGNIVGPTELDVESVEILHGPSSALYGANAYNGLMLINTKNPFDYTGVSTQFKSGVMRQQEGGDNAFYDVALRMAHRFNNSFAGKVNFNYIKANEWVANDQRNRQTDIFEVIDGTVDDTINYDGLNSYGDETMFYPSGIEMRKQGYLEKDLLIKGLKNRNIKFSGSLNYRPFKNDSLEVVLGTNLVLSDNILQGSRTRYVQKDYYFAQSKLEVKSSNFYVRGYYTRNSVKNSYDLTTTGINLNDYTANEYEQYFNKNYFGYLDTIDWTNVTTIEEESAIIKKAILQARAYANQTKLKPNTNTFNDAFNEIISNLPSKNGSKIFDNSAYVHAEGNYDFTSLVNNFIELQIGGSFRKYSPESKGSILNDLNREIKLQEYGAYTQIQKKLFDDRLKLTGSIRYDKSQNFEGNFSPRLGAMYTLGESKNHTIRLSYQTAFRNPSLQEQYLNASGIKTTLGTSKDNLNRISFINKLNLYDKYGIYPDPFKVESVITKYELLNHSVITKNFFDTSGNVEKYVKADYKPIKAESVGNLELGYRSLLRLNNSTVLHIDVNGYYSKHADLIFDQDITVAQVGKLFPHGTQKIPQSEQEIKAGIKDLLSEIYPGFDIPDDVIHYDFYTKMMKDGIMVADFDAVYFDRYTDFFFITNAKSKVDAYGFGISLFSKMFQNYEVGAEYNYADYSYTDLDYGFEPNFNTPKHIVKLKVGNKKVFKNLGFQVDYRWQDKYRWVSSFVKGNINARNVIDGQISYTIPKMKSTFKIGGTNLFGKEYQVAPGTGNIGNLYYFSWTINN